MEKTTRALVLRPTCLLLLLLLFIGLVSSVDNEGIRMRVTENGLNYGAAQLLNLIPSTDQRLRDTGGSSEIFSHTFTLINISGIVKPTGNVEVNPSQGIIIKATGAGASVSANWWYECRLWVFKLSESGSLTARASSTNLSLSVKLGATSSGTPTMLEKNCTATVGSLSLQVSGFTGWIINLFQNQITSYLHSIVGKAICDEVIKAINDNLNRELRDTPVVTTVGGVMNLDYSLMTSPTNGYGYMDAQLMGKFTWKAAPENPPFVPKSLPASSLKTRMVYIWGTEYVINSFIFAAYKQNLLSYNKSLSSIPGLNLGSTFLVSVTATERPYILINITGIKLMAKGRLVVKEGTTTQLELEITIDVDIQAKVEGSTLTANVTSLWPTIQVISTAIGPVSDEAMTLLFTTFSNAVILPELNEIGAKGIAIPEFKDWTLNNTSLMLSTGYILVSTDVKWDL